MSVKVSRILHAGYILESNECRIVFDPVVENPFSTNCYAFPEVTFDVGMFSQQQFDAVVISHFHDDHLSLKSLNLIDKDTPIYLHCYHQEFFDLIKALGFNSVIAIDLQKSFSIGPFTVTALKAVDEDVDAIFHVQIGELNILNVVDAWIHEESINYLRQFSWDLILWPFQTMREVEVLCPQFAEPSDQEIPPEWIQQLKLLNPKIIVPSSCQFIQEPWSWIRTAYFPISYKKFSDSINEHLAACEVLRLGPGQAIDLTQKGFTSAANLKWIQPVGEQTVDYVHNPNPQSVAEVAEHFPDLRQIEKQQLNKYCKEELTKKFSEIGASSDIYFNKARVWKLTLHYPQNNFQDFYFAIDGESLTSCEPGTPEWTSEIPAFKLYRAFFKGEQLTSLYLQINSQKFAPNIHRQLKNTDPLQDPLARILSHRPLSAFQQNQLKSIQP